MEVKSGYKQTDAGVIPNEWASERLEGLCVPGGLVRGPFGGSLKKEFFVRDGYKVYEQRNAIYRNAEIGTYFIDQNKYAELKRFEVTAGDFIVSCSGTIGRIFRMPKGVKAGVINQALLKIKTNSHVVQSDYFYHTFTWDKFQQKIIDSTQGGAMQNLVGMDVFKNTAFSLPPLPEQRAIAAALSDMDALLAAQDKLIAKKQSIKQAAMQELLAGKRRLPGFMGAWDVKRLGDLASISKGSQLHSSDLRDGGIFAHLNGGISPSGYTFKSNTPANTIAISEGGNSCGYVQLMLEPYWCGGHCYSVIPGTTDNYFLYHALKGQQSEIMALRVGSGLPNVQKSALLAFSIQCPTEGNEQQAIAAVLSDMDAEITALTQKRDKTRAVKQGMMQELLTGKIRLV